MRAILMVPLLLSLLIAAARAQNALDIGSPESAFAGGPIRLSKNAASLLRQHYQGDKVPLVPQPFRGRLDTALLGRDWPKVAALTRDLTAASGIVATFGWEQSRFVATGSIGVAEQHALDIAATGATSVAETAVMLWFYAAAVTLTDGHKCANEAARDAHLDRLRGPPFEPVTRIVRTLPDDRLAAMRDLAIRLETVLANERNDDTMCREGNAPAEVKPDAAWRPEAAQTRTMLPRHLVALASVMRPHPIARPEPPAMNIAKPATVKPAPPQAASIVIEPVLPPPVLALPLPELTTDDLRQMMPAAPPQTAPAAAAPPAPMPEPPAPSAETPMPPASVVDRNPGRPDPSRFSRPNLELTVPAPSPGH